MKELNPDYPVFESKGEDDEGPEEIIYDVRTPSSDSFRDRDGREYIFVGK